LQWSRSYLSESNGSVQAKQRWLPRTITRGEEAGLLGVVDGALPVQSRMAERRGELSHPSRCRVNNTSTYFGARPG
jgi:hypothetical protein